MDEHISFIGKANSNRLLRTGQIGLDRSMIPEDTKKGDLLTLTFGNVADGRAVTFHGCKVITVTQAKIMLSLRNAEYITEEKPGDGLEADR